MTVYYAVRCDARFRRVLAGLIDKINKSPIIRYLRLNNNVTIGSKFRLKFLKGCESQYVKRKGTDQVE